MKTQLFLAAIGTLLPQISQAAFVLNELGNGTAALVAGDPMKPNNVNGSVAFSSMVVDRGASGFGDHTTNIEGVYYTYSFAAPAVTNGNGFANFDAQNQMGGIWSGWGDALNGPWQNGPTTGTWNRGNRRQHLYSGANGTSTYTLDMGVPASDATVPVSMMSEPEFGDVLKVSVFLNAVDNTILSVYENLTKAESFTYLTTDAAIPGGNLTFSNIALRSDAGVFSMDYSYGTLVVPEPSASLLVAFSGFGAVMRRKRHA